MNTLFYLFKLILSLIIGVGFGKFLKEKYYRLSGIMLSITLYLLLFFMGVNTGSIDGILSKLNTIGAMAFLVTVANLLGTIFLATIASFIIEKKKSSFIDNKGKINTKKLNVTTKDVSDVLGESLNEESSNLMKKHRLKRLFLIVREPLLLVSIVMLGLLLKLFSPLFNWFSDSLISYLLYCLLFFAGISIVASNLKLKEVFASPVLLLLPVWTILGTYLGALLIPLVTPFTLKEALGLSSGFGWYSLSGIMITDLGHPLLGSISFLSNIFRESFTFFLIPLLANFGRKFYYPSVCCGGATTMDVTLSMLTTHFGTSIMVPSMYHGLVMTLAVPFLIPLFF